MHLSTPGVVREALIACACDGRCFPGFLRHDDHSSGNRGLAINSDPNSQPGPQLSKVTA